MKVPLHGATVRNKVLVISEHQSTVNENMPLRDVIYYGRTIEKLIDPKSLYKRTRIPLPTPEFYVFYNGSEPFPAEKILKLSDAYLEKTDNPMLELSVKVININLPTHHDILQKCRPLYEYSWFIEQIKQYEAAGKTRDEAIISAMHDCRQSDIMADFMKEHGSEAINMLFTEFNMEDALDVRYEEGLIAGQAKGLAIGRTEGLALGRTEGLAIGRTEGLALGMAQSICIIRKKLAKSMPTADIADMLELDADYVTTIKELCESYPDDTDTQIAERYLALSN